MLPVIKSEGAASITFSLPVGGTALCPAPPRSAWLVVAALSRAVRHMPDPSSMREVSGVGIDPVMVWEQQAPVPPAEGHCPGPAPTSYILCLFDP